MSLAARASRRFWSRHPAQSALAVLSLAVGVAVVVAIDIARTSAEQAFRDASLVLAGTTTDVLEAGSKPLDRAVMEDLRRLPGVEQALPVLDRSLAIRGDQGALYTMRLLAVDLVAGRLERSAGLELSEGALDRLYAEAPAVLVTERTRQRLDADGDGRGTAIVGGLTTDFVIAGSITADLPGLDGLLLTDIAHGSALMGTGDRIDRIDLTLAADPSGAQARSLISETWWPPLPSGERGERHLGMTATFHLNLQALSLLALAVGCFVVVQVTRFTVIRRRPLFGQLRAAGCDSGQILRLVLDESFTLALLATVLGLAGGAVLAAVLLPVTSATIGELFLPIPVERVSIPLSTIGKAVAIGLGLGVLAAWGAAREAARAPIRAALARGEQEVEARRARSRSLVVAVIALAIGLAAWAYPSRNILIGYLSLAGVLVGTAALIPIVLALVGAAAPLLPAGVMTVKSAMRAIARSLSRLGPATAALVLAVATAVSIEVMVDSFRSAVSRWLSGSLGADVYVFQPGGLAMAGDRPLDRALIERISEVEGVDRLTTNRIRDLESGAGRLRVSAIAIDESDLSRFQVVDGAPAADWQAFTDATTPGVMITRPLAKHHALAPGDQLTLPTASGPQVFPVLTVLEDYASDRGIAYIHDSVYRRLWQDDRSTGLGLYGNDPADAALLVEQVRAALPSEALVTVATADELRQQSLAIFDRTFAITGILHLMASAVAVIAVISSVGVWQLERRGEWALARAMGLSAVAVRRRILTEVAVLGSITAALALPVGILLAALLISVVNERSFGWTFDLVVPLSALWHGALVAILAALVGGLLPAWQAARRSPARDLAEQEL